ncbi:MAG: hypothetical protein H0U95_15375 [Bacteroidetes bacterium]|nr:hypothetical protein [Bacteroidota bacterium]
MDTSITDNGASIKLTIGALVRNIIKSQIVEVAVIKTNIIKIDIRMGALYNIYIPFSDVINPITANPEALRDAIIAFLPTVTGIAGGATEAKQALEIEVLNAMKTELLNMKGLLIGMDYKILDEPLLIDEGGVKVIYKGYAVIGTLISDATWAIQKIERQGEINITSWANGNKNFENLWEQREALTYK